MSAGFDLFFSSLMSQRFQSTLRGCLTAQNTDDGVTRLKRVILIGDHHQLPPVVKNMAFQKYSHLDQSLFTRFVRLGTPYVQLNAQVPTSCRYKPKPDHMALC